MDNLEFTAQLNKITTTVDGGWRVTFDLGDDESVKLAVLSQLRQSLLKLKIDVCEGEFSS